MNLNQVMLAEEDRDGKGHIACPAPPDTFIACPSKKETTMSSPIRLALAAFIGLLALPAFAQSPTLTIYTYDDFAAEWGPAPGLKSGFEATCGCTVNFVGVDSSIGALRRAQLEGDSTKADIILGLDTSIAEEARQTGIFADHGVDTSALDVPGDWQAADFVPFDYAYFAFVYNKESLPNPPTSFEELIAADADLKIALQDPRSSTPGLGLVLWIKAAYGDRAAEIWEGLAPHILTVAKSWSDAYALLLSGEADMALSYTTSPAYHMIAEEDDRYLAAPFSEGYYLQVEVAGILKSSENQDLARDFLAYLITPEAQGIIPTTNWVYPIADLPDGLPAAFDTLIKPEPVLLLDDKLVDEKSNEWIAEMFEAIQ